MFNVSEYEVFQKDQWNSERKVLFTKVKNFCTANNIGFNLLDSEILNNKFNKNIFILQGELIPSFDSWKKLNDECVKAGKFLIVINDNILKFTEELSSIKFFSCIEFYGVMNVFDWSLDDLPTPSKLFNCFMQRIDSVRQTWFYFLYQNNLLDQGYVSFLLKQVVDYSTATGLELFDYIHQTYNLGQLPHFNEAYQNLKTQVPYRNFEETFDLNDYILDSKYSLILETYATNDDCAHWYFSEKSLRSLQFPNLNLLFVQKGGVEILESLGFLFGVSLVELDNLSWPERQLKLLDFLITDPVPYNKKQLIDISMHNRSIFKNWQEEYQKETYFDKIFDFILEA